ncbi:MAG TPA: MFS transporter [Methylomirabilota bacterium]|nr:MFS transporter [Methylomirabilota bacterium]
MEFPAALRALNHRDFRLFWTGQSVSSVGSWMQSVGLSWLVLELTNSPFRLGLVSALQFGPVLLFSAVAGVVVDRTPKRRLILSTQIALMLPALALAVLASTGWVRYWHVATLAGLIGVVNALDMPSRQSFLVELVGREDLLNAIALNSATFNAARVIGPALGGVIIARYGTAIAFLLNALSFGAVVATLTLVRSGGEARPRRGTTIREELLDGVRYATRTPLVALILGLVFAVSTFAMNHGVLVPLFAREVLHEGVHEFGLLMASLGAGAVTGAVALAVLAYGRPTLAAVVIPGLGVAVGILALGFVRHFALAAVVLFGVGAMQIVFQNGCNTIVQMTVPDELRGRVMGVYMMVFAGATPVGASLIGSVAEGVGVPAACIVGGGLALLGVLVQLARWRRAKHVYA